MKYELARSRGSKSEGGKLVEARLTWGCDAAAGGDGGGAVRVVHAWQQGGKEQSVEKVVPCGGEAYSFNAGQGMVRNLSISIEPADYPPVSAGPHPLMMQAPLVESRDLRNTAAVKGLREAVAKLEQSPTVATALEIIQTSSNGWARTATTAALMAIGGEPARQALKQSTGKTEWVDMCLTEMTGLSGPLAELSALLASTNAANRAETARYLALRAEPGAVGGLRGALSREENADALAAEAAALVRCGGKEAGEEAAAFLDRCEPRGRIELASALASTGVTSGFAMLEKTGTSDENPYMRCAATAGLAQSGRKEAAPALRKMLKDSSRWVRQEALAGLAKCGGPESVEDVRRLADSDPLPYLRTEALWTIGRMQSR